MLPFLPASCAARLRALKLPDFGIDNKAVPESLKEVENQTGFSVQKAEAQKIPIQPVGECAPEQRRAGIEVLLGPAPAARLIGKGGAAR